MASAEAPAKVDKAGSAAELEVEVGAPEELVAPEAVLAAVKGVEVVVEARAVKGVREVEVVALVALVEARAVKGVPEAVLVVVPEELVAPEVEPEGLAVAVGLPEALAVPAVKVAKPRGPTLTSTRSCSLF